MYQPENNDLIGRLITLLKTLDLDLRLHAFKKLDAEGIEKDYCNLQYLVNHTLVLRGNKLNDRNVERVEKAGFWVVLNDGVIHLIHPQGKVPVPIEDTRPNLLYSEEDWRAKLV